MLMVAGQRKDYKIMVKIPVIIPARAGSKGIIGKNIVEFCGKPLISWTIRQALDSDRVSNVYVSTNGEDIAEVSEKNGARIIWRPSELSTDTSSSEDAIMHAIKEIEKNEDFQSVVFLQATSPIRRKNDIDCAIKEFEFGQYDSLFSMAILEDYCIWKRKGERLYSFTYDYLKRGRRQEREPLYLENGSIYVFKKELFFEKKNRLGGKIGMYEMPFECSYEIDSQKDIAICEYFMNCVIKGEII